MTTQIPPITDLATGRRTLLAAAEDQGATITSYPHPLGGPDGEALCTDVVRYGAPIGQADRVVLLLSGLHGVEGHAGTGLQQLLVDSHRLRALPAGMAVLLVHAVNPYGYAWSRRVDHRNVDVNRNFVDFADPAQLPTNPRYTELDAALNPTDATFDPDDRSFLETVAAFWAEVGDDAAMRTLNGGQYTHPRGIQFGGQEATWSRHTLEQIWATHLAGATRAVQLDVHTGLGPCGRLTVFQTADPDETAAELGRDLYAEHLWCAPRTTDDPVDHGLLGPGFDVWAATDAADPLDTATFVLEFGTGDPVSGLTVFRADNWVHNQGDPRDATGARVARMMREQFFIDDPSWRGEVATQGVGAIEAALDAMCGHMRG